MQFLSDMHAIFKASKALSHADSKLASQIGSGCMKDPTRVFWEEGHTDHEIDLMTPPTIYRISWEGDRAHSFKNSSQCPHSKFFTVTYKLPY